MDVSATLAVDAMGRGIPRGERQGGRNVGPVVEALPGGHSERTDQREAMEQLHLMCSS